MPDPHASTPMSVPVPRGQHLVRGAKYATCKASLLALGATFELVSAMVPEMKDEVSRWEDGRKVGIGVLPGGPFITIENRGGAIRYVGSGLKDTDLNVLFKNLDSAVLIFTGQLGSAQAVAENRVCVHGDNSKAMQVTRSLALVQTYLFPGIILRNTFKRPPALSASQLATKAAIMAMLVPKLAAISFR